MSNIKASSIHSKQGSKQNEWMVTEKSPILRLHFLKNSKRGISDYQGTKAALKERRIKGIVRSNNIDNGQNLLTKIERASRLWLGLNSEPSWEKRGKSEKDKILSLMSHRRTERIYKMFTASLWWRPRIRWERSMRIHIKPRLSCLSRFIWWLGWTATHLLNI